jgi:predicted ATPase
MSPPLNRIVLKGFKSIREMELELRPLNILIGANGSGKSNFASFFPLVRHTVEQNLERFVQALTVEQFERLFYCGTERTKCVECELRFADGGWAFSLNPQPAPRIVIADEKWDFPGMPGGGIEGGFAVEARLPDAARPEPDSPGWKAFWDMERWRVHHFADTSALRGHCDIRDNEFLKSDGSNLAAVLLRLRQQAPEYYRNIVDAVRMIASFFDDFLLRPSQRLENAIELEWHDRLAEKYFGPESWSDGTLRFIGLATLLLQPDPPPLVIIDEPELGMHPAALALLAGMLRSVSATRQVVVCTQSVTLVNHFAPEDIVVVNRVNGASSFKRLTAAELAGWLDDYALGELWEKNVIEGRP